LCSLCLCGEFNKKMKEEKVFPSEVVLKRIENLGFSLLPKPDLGGNAYLLNNEILIDIQSTPLSISRRDYTFKLDEARFDYFYEHHRHFFLLLMCESDKRVFVLPLALIMEIFHDIYAVGHSFKQFKPVIKLKNGVWFLRFFGQYDITDYLNRYDFLITESKTLPSKPTRFNSIIEIKSLEERFAQLAESGEIRGESLHIATVDMLKKIGEWSGFEVITEGALRDLPDFPYQIDVLWYKNGDLYLAIEVCHHGVVEKDKDALKLARQLGARKVIIVSEVNKMERIRRLFQFEGEVKSWAEVWSFERVFGMFESGLKFYKDFEKFRRYGWQEGLTEFI
jgi:hypothetical protein